MNKKRSTLIIVLGPPAAGKTTLALNLSKELNVPVMGKDQIKELIFDTIGWSDKKWNQKVTKAGYSILYNVLNVILSSGSSLIVESNFTERDTDRFFKLQKKHGFKIIQIICTTQGEVLVERFKKRAKSGERHPGHTDNLNYNEFRYEVAKIEEKPLSLSGRVLKFDTTNLKTLDYTPLFQKIRNYL